MRRWLAASVALGAAMTLSGHVPAQEAVSAEKRPRARELGIAPGRHAPGPLNSITDVPGVRVGHATLVSGANIRTGVTAILPHGGNVYREKVPAAIHVFNAFGKLVGSTQVEELGQLETPILLTNTLSVWDAAAALTDWMLAMPGNENVRSINPVVGETNDGGLNDARGRHVKAEHVRAALAAALSERGTGAVEEGAVGAGTGTIAFGWKGGIGTSSRVASVGGTDAASKYTIGVLVQTNFGGVLTIDGVPVWKTLRPPQRAASLGNAGGEKRDDADGSCMIVVATDAPLDARQLKRLAARAMHGMARAGSSGSHGSGDYVIAFSTANRYAPFDSTAPVRQITTLREDDLSPLFSAVIEATEEAIYNSLLRATTVKGRDGLVVEAIPIEKLRELLKEKTK